MENVLEMDFAQYWNLFQYLKKRVYPEGFTKQDKTTLRKFAKKFEYDLKTESLLFYVAKEKDCTALRRLVITEEEKARVFEECHSAPFTGHADRDNALGKIKERFLLAWLLQGHDAPSGLCQALRYYSGGVLNEQSENKTRATFTFTTISEPGTG